MTSDVPEVNVNVYAVPGVTAWLPLELFPLNVAVPVIVQLTVLTPAGHVHV